MRDRARQKIAVVGSGISGLSAAWLLSRDHDVTLYEHAERVGGHANTVDVTVGQQTLSIDTGFIVFNRVTYPNLTALFDHLDVPTQPSNMSFAASLDGGAMEYAGGTGLRGLFAQKRNVLRPRFLEMLVEVRRFYRQSSKLLANPAMTSLTLGEYLDADGYSQSFREDHLLPMASAIWSATTKEMLSYPAAAFIRFHANHGLLQFSERPEWETVCGGSRTYVERIIQDFAGTIRLDSAVLDVRRYPDHVQIIDRKGLCETYDHVVMASHADQALAVLADPSAEETLLLGAFRYQRNLAVLHSDPRFMPQRRAAWASWNYIGGNASDGSDASFTYWMNRLQNIPGERQFFVTLNPHTPPTPEMLHHSESYDHPLFDSAAIAAQQQLWSLQGRQRTWFCGAYFGAGFHEDGLQAGLAVAEQLGEVRRPWSVPNESGRIVLGMQHEILGETELSQ
jgi:uncharacterized protein